MEVGVAGREEIMSENDRDTLMRGGEPPNPEDIMSESGSEIILWEERHMIKDF